MNLQAAEHIAADLFNVVLTAIWLNLLWHWKTCRGNWKPYVYATVTALFINVIISQLNRWTGLWPSELYFPSGHMIYAVTMAFSIGCIFRAVIIIFIPALIGYGFLIVCLNYHRWIDIIGAVAIGLPVTWACHKLFRDKSTGTAT